MAGGTGRGCEWAQSVLGTLWWDHRLPPLLSLFGTGRAMGPVRSLLIFLFLADTEATSGEGASQGSEYFPLALVPLRTVPRGLWVQALGPEGLYDIVGWYLRAAFPKVCSWHTSWGS